MNLQKLLKSQTYNYKLKKTEVTFFNRDSKLYVTTTWASFVIFDVQLTVYIQNCWLRGENIHASVEILCQILKVILGHQSQAKYTPILERQLNVLGYKDGGGIP